MIEQGLLEIPILYLSRHFIENKNDYYAGLRSVTEDSDWKGWVLYVLDAVEKTAIDTKKKILSMEEEYRQDSKVMQIGSIDNLVRVKNLLKDQNRG